MKLAIIALTEDQINLCRNCVYAYAFRSIRKARRAVRCSLRIGNKPLFDILCVKQAKRAIRLIGVVEVPNINGEMFYD